MNYEKMNEQRYIKLKEEPNLIRINAIDLTENFVPVYLQALHVPPLDINVITDELDEPPKDASKVENILLRGYACAYNDYIYIEYLNTDGFLKTIIYSKYFDFPQLYMRNIL